MNWFERLTGFPEVSHAETQSRLKLENGRLHSLVNGRSYGVGTLELVSLAELRERTRDAFVPGQLRLGIAQGDVRALQAGLLRALLAQRRTLPSGQGRTAGDLRVPA